MAHRHKKHEAAQQKAKPRRRIAARVFFEAGASPGTLRPVPNSAPASMATLSCRGDDTCALQNITDMADLPRPAPKGAHWLRVTGLGSVDALQAVINVYDLPRLAMEDALNPGCRTKFEQQSDYAFFVFQAPPEVDQSRKGEHLSLFCRPGLVITFEEAPTAIVDAVWARLQQNPPDGRFAHLAELLTYLILDSVVDGFFPHLDQKDEKLAELEELISDHVPTRDELNRLHQVKRGLITLRRLLSPFKELRTDLPKIHTPESAKELRPFFNDVIDHVVQIGELLDTYYEVAKSLEDISQSAISNRMNDIIKILTIISTVFMPLSFIAGVYGMNFDTQHPLNMPELSLPFGYPLALFFMVSIVGVMLWFFRKKDWL